MTPTERAEEKGKLLDLLAKPLDPAAHARVLDSIRRLDRSEQAEQVAQRAATFAQVDVHALSDRKYAGHKASMMRALRGAR